MRGRYLTSRAHGLDVFLSAAKARWIAAKFRKGVLYVQGLRRRLSTWDEADDEDQEDAPEGAVNRGDSHELQHASQCAAELLRTSSLIALGTLDSGGQLNAATSSPQWGACLVINIVMWLFGVGCFCGAGSAQGHVLTASLYLSDCARAWGIPQCSPGLPEVRHHGQACSMQSSSALSSCACIAPRSENGKVIGAAEGNKEMADRNNGFGAYDVPFLGPTRTGTKGRGEEEESAEVGYVPDTSLSRHQKDL